MKATGLQGDASIDIIENLDDGTDAFGDRVPNTTIYDTGGPRWVGPVAAIALVAIIGFGVTTSASNNGAAKVAPAPSTSIAGTPTTTALPFTTTVAAAPLVPYYAADPPRELTVQYANIQSPDDSAFGPSNYQLWATPDATSTSGSWFSVESYAAGGGSIFATDAYRVQAENLSIAISLLPNGVTLAQFNSAARHTVTLTSFGLADADIVKLAQAVRIARGIVQFSDRAVVDGFEMVSTSQPWSVVLGFPIESLFYSDGNSPHGGISLVVAQRNPATEWSGVELQAARHSSDNNFGNYDQSDAVPVSFGTDAPDPDLDRTVAAYAFSEVVGYTAQIIVPDGAVPANWPPT